MSGGGGVVSNIDTLVRLIGDVYYGNRLNNIITGTLRFSVYKYIVYANLHDVLMYDTNFIPIDNMKLIDIEKNVMNNTKNIIHSRYYDMFKHSYDSVLSNSTEIINIIPVYNRLLSDRCERCYSNDTCKYIVGYNEMSPNNAMSVLVNGYDPGRMNRNDIGFFGKGIYFERTFTSSYSQGFTGKTIRKVIKNTTLNDDDVYCVKIMSKIRYNRYAYPVNYYKNLNTIRHNNVDRYDNTPVALNKSEISYDSELYDEINTRCCSRLDDYINKYKGKRVIKIQNNNGWSIKKCDDSCCSVIFDDDWYEGKSNNGPDVEVDMVIAPELEYFKTNECMCNMNFIVLNSQDLSDDELSFTVDIGTTCTKIWKIIVNEYINDFNDNYRLRTWNMIEPLINEHNKKYIETVFSNIMYAEHNVNHDIAMGISNNTDAKYNEYLLMLDECKNRQTADDVTRLLERIYYKTIIKVLNTKTDLKGILACGSYETMSGEMCVRDYKSIEPLAVIIYKLNENNCIYPKEMVDITNDNELKIDDMTKEWTIKFHLKCYQHDINVNNLTIYEENEWLKYKNIKDESYMKLLRKMNNMKLLYIEILIKLIVSNNYTNYDNIDNIDEEELYELIQHCIIYDKSLDYVIKNRNNIVNEYDIRVIHDYIYEPLYMQYIKNISDCNPRILTLLDFLTIDQGVIFICILLYLFKSRNSKRDILNCIEIMSIDNIKTFLIILYKYICNNANKRKNEIIKMIPDLLKDCKNNNKICDINDNTYYESYEKIINTFKTL